jgi:tRNA A-37 threonylcarbamoyl transferase component Bud32
LRAIPSKIRFRGWSRRRTVAYHYESSLGLLGIVTFESHTNLGTTDVSESIEHMSIGRDDAGATASNPRSLGTKVRRRARGKGNQADQFCIYRISDGRNVPAVAIEYKAPHKLSRDEIVTGLASEIQPERDVINKDGEGFAFASRSLAAAVVTQLFSYMVGKGIQYGYVCTGEVFIFLHIPNDPTIVYYSVCVPNLDVVDDDETRLHRTAVAQVFAFILQALRVEPPPLSWHDEAEGLGTWAVEYDDVLRKIPPTVRKDPHASPYKPQRRQGFTRSPILTRSRCQHLDSNVRGRGDDDNEEESTPPSPTPNRSSHLGENAVVSSKETCSSGGGQRSESTTQKKIQDRPFCTHQCLLGLAYGGLMDDHCPNFNDHKQGHIDGLEFLRLIRAQLAKDRGPDADCVPLYLSGSRGSLFKVRLSSHGYTLVAKGVEEIDLGRLRHENKLYDRLQAVQGKHVPVCLGVIDLVLPCYYDSGVFVYFMFLSSAGRPLLECINKVNKTIIVDEVTTAFTELHRLRILHCDAKARNILYDTQSGNFMIVDFERGKFYGRQPLSLISSNPQNWNGKRKMSQKRGNDVFSGELQSVVEWVSKCDNRAALKGFPGMAVPVIL